MNDKIQHLLLVISFCSAKFYAPRGCMCVDAQRSLLCVSQHVAAPCRYITIKQSRMTVTRGGGWCRWCSISVIATRSMYMQTARNGHLTLFSSTSVGCSPRNHPIACAGVCVDMSLCSTSQFQQETLVELACILRSSPESEQGHGNLSFNCTW